MGRRRRRRRCRPRPRIFRRRRRWRRWRCLPPPAGPSFRDWPAIFENLGRAHSKRSDVSRERHSAALRPGLFNEPRKIGKIYGERLLPSRHDNVCRLIFPFLLTRYNNIIIAAAHLSRTNIERALICRSIIC
jgi:hypothetical protein